MEYLGFDEVKIDKVGNIIGIVKGYKSSDDIVLFSNIDFPSSVRNEGNKFNVNDYNFFENDKSGILTSLFTGALLKRSMAMLTGDLIIACITRSDCCGFGVKHLFNEHLKKRKIKGDVYSLMFQNVRSVHVDWVR